MIHAPCSHLHVHRCCVNAGMAMPEQGRVCNSNGSTSNGSQDDGKQVDTTGVHLERVVLTTSGDADPLIIQH